MFISKAEKNAMQLAIRILQSEIKEISILIAKQNAQPTAEKKRKTRNVTEESRAAASARMKKYWADRKAKKESA